MEKRREKKQSGLKIRGYSEVVKGSLVWLKRECGKENCRCRRGKKHVSLYVSRSHKSKTQMMYIPHRYEETVIEGVKRYKAIVGMLDKISQENLKKIKQRDKV